MYKNFILLFLLKLIKKKQNKKYKQQIFNYKLYNKFLLDNKRIEKIMVWQDYAITVIIYMFVIVTIPQVIDVLKKGTKLNLVTAGPTALGNYLLAYVFSTLGLWIYVSSSILIATLWLLIFFGSWKNSN